MSSERWFRILEREAHYIQQDTDEMHCTISSWLLTHNDMLDIDRIYATYERQITYCFKAFLLWVYHDQTLGLETLDDE